MPLRRVTSSVNVVPFGSFSKESSFTAATDEPRESLRVWPGRMPMPPPDS